MIRSRYHFYSSFVFRRNRFVLIASFCSCCCCWALFNNALNRSRFHWKCNHSRWKILIRQWWQVYKVDLYFKKIRLSPMKTIKYVEILTKNMETLTRVTKHHKTFYFTCFIVTARVIRYSGNDHISKVKCFQTNRNTFESLERAPKFIHSERRIQRKRCIWVRMTNCRR